MHSLCPGGGVNFAGVVTFDQSWISGCTAACTGGVAFDNRAACEPTTALDACAPAPGCTSGTNGSDLWFRFFASATTATISVRQQVNFVAAIQVFSGGPTCGALTEIGCAVAANQSTPVSVNLTSLTLGALYYFRVFGSTNSAPQRTGVFCFCGSTGLGSAPLPVVLTEFKAIAQKNRVIIKWSTASEFDNRSFDIERSIDGTNYTSITTIDGNGTTQTTKNYEYTDLFAVKGTNYYRLKINSTTGAPKYSEIRVARIDYGKTLSVYSNPVRDNLVIDASAPAKVVIMNLSGQALQTIQLSRGRNTIPVSGLSAGSYILKSLTDNESYKFNIIK